MPAAADLKDLEAVNLALELLKGENPDYYKKFQELFKKYRMIGYKNICKLLLDESTPKKLKGVE